MNLPWPLFVTQTGAAGPQRLLTPSESPQSLLAELGPIFIVLVSILILGLVLFLVVYWYKRDRSGATVLHADHRTSHHGRRHRKRLHAHRPRNPTLAETGGLPPPRDELPAPPPSSPT